MKDQGTEPGCVALTLPIKTMEDVALVGHAMAASGMFGLKNDAQGMVLAMTCIGEGMTPVAFKRKYHVHEDGTLSMRADYMAAGFRARGGRYTIRERSPKRAAALFEFEGNKVEAEFTIADAERHGYTKNGKGEVKHNWAKHPENMLWARIVSENVRVLTPEVCAGLYTPEEVVEFPGNEREEIPIAPEEAAKKMPPAKAAGEVIDIKAEAVPAEPAPAVTTPAPAPKKARKPVTVKAAEPTPFDDPAPAAPEAPASPAVNYGLCPMPPLVGKPWAEMPDSHLRHALKAVHADVTDGHREAINLILAERAGK